MSPGELESIRERYARRSAVPQSVYDPLSAWIYMSMQERERALIAWIHRSGLMPVQNRRVLEIGCGFGQNLLQFLRLGFLPENLVANELIEARAEMARRLLPRAINVVTGDATALSFPSRSFDVVFQSTVFSSILDEGFRKRLAEHLWTLVAPGGGILWYDFVYDNPRNPDVRGVRPSAVRALFPEGVMRMRRLTLAPPISRAVCRVHPQLYTFFNVFPFLRTHVLCWIAKPGASSGSTF